MHVRKGRGDPETCYKGVCERTCNYKRSNNSRFDDECIKGTNRKEVKKILQLWKKGKQKSRQIQAKNENVQNYEKLKEKK